MAIIQSENNRVLVRPEHLKGGLIRAQPGMPLHVRIHADLSPAYAMPEGVFDLDSAFPRRGVFGYLRSIATHIAPLLEPRVTLFGHADQSGGELHNKGLSERRAKVVYAMLTGELELFTEVAEDEFWSTPTYQRMLNLLGCNAGKADGIKGPKTRAAFKRFQKDYNALLYHLNYNGRTRAYDELTVDGIFGDRTRDAMHDAYLSKVPFTLDPATFTSTPFAGCSEFNRRGDDAKQNRRVTLALWKGDLPLDSKFPCKGGDPKACPVHPESKTPHRRCKFYRFFVDKEQELQSRQMGLGVAGNTAMLFFDNDWELNQFDEHFQLVGSNGYNVTLGAADLEAQGEHGMRLDFEQLNKGETYTLRHHYGETVVADVFKDLTYEQVLGVRSPPPILKRTEGTSSRDNKKQDDKKQDEKQQDDESHVCIADLTQATEEYCDADC